MKKTTQEVKRGNIKELLDKTLQSQAIKLRPLDITVGESLKSDFTKVNLAFSETIGGVNRCIEPNPIQSRGLVDGIFKACYKTFSDRYSSLSNLELYDYKVKPDFSKRPGDFGADIGVEVGIMVHVKNHGIAEFNNYSRSLVHSSFFATLEMFEFYINCQKTFDKLQVVLQNAQARNRADIEQQCISNLCTLTSVNNYEKQ